MNKLLLLFFLFPLAAVAQKNSNTTSFRKEIRIITDNDAYLLKRRDGYYTNGIFIQHNWAARSQRIIRGFEFGQKMYTSRNRFLTTAQFDRPFAAYLFLQYKQTQFYKKNDVFKWSVALGTIGPNALGEEVQINYHKLIHIYTPKGWGVQVNNEIGLNGSFTWAPSVMTNQKAGLFGLKPIVTANVGNTFTNAELGSLFQFGAFEKNSQSALWNASLGATESKRNYELYAFFFPQVIFTGYNATVQGPLLRNDKGVFTSDVKRMMYRHRFGFMFSKKRISTGLDFVFETKEATTQKGFQRYGSFHAGYRFN